MRTGSEVLHPLPSPTPVSESGGYYPILLDLRGRLCAVIGGGPMAREKVQGLLVAGARVKVVARELVPELVELARSGRIRHLARNYRRRDLWGVFLVVAERKDPAFNQRIFRDALRRRIPVNVVDDPEHCTFIAPAVLRRSDLTVAISTGGKAPALAVRLREELEARLGPEYGRFLELAGELRPRLAEIYPDFETRRSLWYRLVDSEVLQLLRQGDEEGARARIAALVTPGPGGTAP